jgi:hypothetical protein
MKMVFNVAFREGSLKASDFMVAARDIESAIARAKQILTRNYKSDPDAWENPAKVWVSDVTLCNEVEE